MSIVPGCPCCCQQKRLKQYHNVTCLARIFGRSFMIGICQCWSFMIGICRAEVQNTADRKWLVCSVCSRSKATQGTAVV